MHNLNAFHVIDCKFFVRLTDLSIVKMCWSLHVYWTVFYNLFARFVTNVANLFYNNNNKGCCCYCCCCGSHKHAQQRASADSTSMITVPNNGLIVDIADRSSPNFHDYVIVGEYLGIAGGEYVKFLY